MPVAILQKAVDELKGTTPRLDYIRGLLETLIELQPKPAVVSGEPFKGFGFVPPPSPHIGTNGKPALKIGKLD